MPPLRRVIHVGRLSGRIHVTLPVRDGDLPAVRNGDAVIKWFVALAVADVAAAFDVAEQRSVLVVFGIFPSAADHRLAFDVDARKFFAARERLVFRRNRRVAHQRGRPGGRGLRGAGRVRRAGIGIENRRRDATRIGIETGRTSRAARRLERDGRNGDFAAVVEFVVLDTLLMRLAEKRTQLRSLARKMWFRFFCAGLVFFRLDFLAERRTRSEQHGNARRQNTTFSAVIFECVSSSHVWHAAGLDKMWGGLQMEKSKKEHPLACIILLTRVGMVVTDSWYMP